MTRDDVRILVVMGFALLTLAMATRALMLALVLTVETADIRKYQPSGNED